MAVTQKNRKIQIVTPLGEDVLLFYQMHGRECLSESFEYNLELLSASENPCINPEQILGENVTISLQLADGTWRYFNGYVTRFGQYGNLNVFSYYRATVRPWLWFLTKASNCRIFQNKTVPDIIKQVFRDQGFSDFKEKLSGSYSPREYCVQYRETDFNFVSRLMEEEGIYYYFTHEQEKHYLVMIDAGNAHDQFPGYEKIPYHADTSDTDRSRLEHIYDWGCAREVQPGAYEQTAYDFKNPKANLLVKSKIKETHAHANYEFFDYPGCYTETGVGENFVRRRIEEQHTRFECCEGKCNARGLAVGYLFNLEDCPRKAQNRKYLVILAHYHLLLSEYTSQSNPLGEGNFFACSFTAQDNKRPFRPARSSPKPLVYGAQTAVVVGPAGEEIYTDKYGRVKVLFHWDRKERWEAGKQEKDSSCWIRVSHPWAGKGWGSVSIPRIGQEVIVDFLEGDPDQPIITGRVYNADNMPPYGGGVVSGLKSNTHKGKGYNEMSMDDTAGKEKITIHSQYDMDTTVEHDQTNTVVAGNDTTTVKAGTQSVTVKGNTSLTVQAGDRIVNVTGNYKLDTTSEINMQAPSKITLTCGGSTITMEPGKITISAGGGAKIVLDANALTQASAGNKVLLDGNALMDSTAGDKVLLDGKATMSSPAEAKVEAPTAILLGGGGGSTVKNDAAGVTVNGAKISLNG